MADNHSKEIRSKNMSHIRSTNTKPEERVRKYLFSKGFRYRKNVRELPGCPDIVLPKYKTVVFVNSAFAGRVIVVYSCYFVGFAWIFVWFGVFSKEVHKLSIWTIEGVYFFYVCEMVLM